MPGSAPQQQHWTVEVLGPCRLVDGRSTPHTALTPSEFQALVVGLLVIVAPRSVGREQLCDWLWRGRPPATARASLHNQVSRLRARTTDGLIATTSNGYRLHAVTDLDEVRRAADDAERHHHRGDFAAAHDRANRALDRFRGEPLMELDALDLVAQLSVLRHEVSEIRRALEDVRLASAVALGRTAWAIREAERLVAATPLDEGRWHLLVEALHKAGRRGDALAALDRARRALRLQLGLTLGTELRAAEAAVLAPGPVDHVRSAPPSVPIRPQVVEQVVAHAMNGGVAVVSGEHGIGRSTLLEAAHRQTRRQRCRSAATAVEAPGGVALAPLEDLLSELGITAREPLGRVTGFVRAVSDLADTGPVILVIDDLDLAGPTTRSTLMTAAQHPAIGVIASTHDTDWMRDLPVAPLHVELQPLDSDTVGDVVQTFNPQALVHMDAQRWTVLSGGNPLLLRCLLDDFSEGRLELADTAAVAGSRLGNVVQRQIDQLGVYGRDAVEAAAVCGVSATPELVSRLSSPHGVAVARAAGMLQVQDGRLRFRHGAMESAAYHGIAEWRRQELHLLAARHEQQHGGDPEAMAHHAMAAAPLDPRLAVDAARSAAARAAGRGAHLDAARWHQRALEAAEHTDDRTDRVRALIGLGDELRLAGDPRHAAWLLEAVDAAEAYGEPGLIAEAVFALVQLGATSETGALHTRAVKVAERTLAQLPADHDGWAHVAAAASIAQSLFGDVAQSRRLYLDAEARATSEAARLRVLPATYLALGHPGDLDQRERLTAELLELARRHGDPVAEFEGQHLVFSNALQRADGPTAREAVARMADLVSVVGDAGRRWQYLYCTAAVAHLDGDLDAAERWTDEAYQLFAAVSPSRAFAAHISQLLVIRLAQGRLDELADTFAHLVAHQPEVAAWHPLYAATCVNRDAATARHHAAVALEVLPDDFTWLAAHLIGAYAATRVSPPEVIEQYRQRLEPWAERVAWQGTCAFGPVAGALAELTAAVGNHHESQRHRQSADRLARSLQAPVFLSND